MGTLDRLGQVLLELGFVTEAELLRALEEQKASKRKLGQQLVLDGVLTEERLVSALSRYLGLAAVEPARNPVHASVLAMVDKSLAKTQRIIPIARKKVQDKEILYVATADPFDPGAEEALKAVLPPGMTIEWMLAGQEEMDAGLIHHYGGNTGQAPIARTSGTEFGPYVLERRLGAGGMSEIFAARAWGAESNSELLALKRLLPHLAKGTDFRRMFLEEAALCVGLRHPNVVGVYDSGEVDAQPYIAMELVDGRDARWVIDQLKKRGEQMPLEIALHLMIELLKGLSYVHDAKDNAGKPLGIIHRDVSPSNVLLSLWGEVKIGDFGVAKAASREEIRATALKGKSGYMAPEQLLGQNLDHRADIFAAGVLFYELLTLRPLLGASEGNPAAIERRLDSEVDKSLRHYRPDIPSKLEEILLLAVAKDPSDRFQTTTAFRAAVQALRDEGNLSISSVRLSRFLQELSGEDDEATKANRARATAVGSYPVPAPDYDPKDEQLASRVKEGLGDAAEWVGNRVVPAVVEGASAATRRSSEVAGRAGSWFLASSRAAQAGVVLGPVVLFAIFIEVFSGGVNQPEPDPVLEETQTSTVEPVRVDRLIEREPVGPREILPGLYEARAQKGEAYVAQEDAPLYATADRTTELMRLPPGERVRALFAQDGMDLVLLLPRGPAGFIEGGQLVEQIPAWALAARLPLEGCATKTKEPLEACLLRARGQSDLCLDRCIERDPGGAPGSRCTEVCQAAATRCMRGCRVKPKK